MNVLLTGFGVFHNFEVNPTEVLVNAFREIEGVNLKKVVFKVDFDLVAAAYATILADFKPDLILNLGLNAAAVGIQLEEFALNSAAPFKAMIMDGGAAAYRTTLPLETLAQKINEAGIPCQLSQHAGTYLCNFIYYNSLHYMQTQGGEALFLHMPFSTELVCELALNKQSLYPSLPMEALQKTVELVVANFKSYNKS